MTSRERILAAFRNEERDRVAWCPELNDYFVARELRRGGKKPPPECPDGRAWKYGAANELVGGDTLWSARSFSEEAKDVTRKTEDKDGRTVTVIEGPKGVLRQVQHFDEIARTTFTDEHPIKTVEDFWVLLDVLERTEVSPDPEAYDRAEDALQDRGASTIWAPETPLMSLIMWRMGIEETLYACFDHPEEMSYFLGGIHDYNRRVYHAVCQARGEVVRCFEDTSSNLTSPDMYRRLAAPHLSDYAGICHSYGKQFVPHMCGKLHDMVGVLRDVPMDGIEAATPPPTGDASARFLREELGDELLIIGGLDATRASLCREDEFRRLVERTLDEMQGDRRFILGSEEFSVAAKMENVLLVGELVRGRVS